MNIEGIERIREEIREGICGEMEFGIEEERGGAK